MSTLSSSGAVRVGAAIRTVSRRLRRFAFRYDALEVRQLLSVGQPTAAANPIVVQPAISATPLFGSSIPTGLSPTTVQSAYGANQISFGNVTGNGAGQTIAIIDAYFDPSIASDLQKFDSQYGLQAPPSFTQYVQNGFLPTDAGWSLETALDVEWAHAMAPAANIVLVEAQPTLNDLFSAVSFASHLPGVSVVSMSWGAGEFAGESAYDSVFTTPAGHNGVTFVASSGDSGTTEYPSASPNVLSVGGTTLTVTSQGTYVSESPWSGSGTGTSPFEAQPAWQASAASAAGLPIDRPHHARRLVRRQPVDGRLGVQFGSLRGPRRLVYRRRHQRRRAGMGRAWSPSPTRASRRWASDRCRTCRRASTRSPRSPLTTRPRAAQRRPLTHSAPVSAARRRARSSRRSSSSIRRERALRQRRRPLRPRAPASRSIT